MCATTTLGNVQCLNALAVHYIDDQDYRGAAEVIEAAISDWDNCLLSPTPIGITGVKQQDQNISAYLAGYLDYRHETFVVHPFLFECDAAFSDDFCVTAEHHSYVSTTLFYNLGLCYHLSSFGSVHLHKTLLLYKALQAYQQGYLLARCFLREIGSHAVSPSVVRALCHNATHCSLELDDLQRSKFWNQQLGWAICTNFAQEGTEDEEESLASRAFFKMCLFRNQFGGTAARAA